MRQFGEERLTGIADDRDDKPVFAAVDQFGQGEIITVRRLRPHMHRGAKSGSTRNAAIDGDDE